MIIVLMICKSSPIRNRERRKDVTFQEKFVPFLFVPSSGNPKRSGIKATTSAHSSAGHRVGPMFCKSCGVNYPMQHPAPL